MGFLGRLGLEGPVPLRCSVRVSDPAAIKVVAVVTRDPATSTLLRPRAALLANAEPLSEQLIAGFSVVLRRAATWGSVEDNPGTFVAYIPNALDYLDEGDVILIDPQAGLLHVLYRRWSDHNTLLVTERCNSRCVMCSQPPILRDDSYLVDEVLRAIPLIHPKTKELGLTGGEPTLLGEGLLGIIRAARDYLPETELHVLSNGRLFCYMHVARNVAEQRHPGLIFGIPLYSDIAGKHDVVVQAGGAFDQTVRGLVNLARFGVRIEVRVVVHRMTYERLPQLAAFIARHLPFVEHVALMGIEPIGYMRRNADAVWIDPGEYQPELVAAVRCLDGAGMAVSVYNHQLCVLDHQLWPFAARSISDWKNIYHEECKGCAARPTCTGFFASSDFRRSAHIRAL